MARQAKGRKKFSSIVGGTGSNCDACLSDYTTDNAIQIDHKKLTIALRVDPAAHMVVGYAGLTFESGYYLYSNVEKSRLDEAIGLAMETGENGVEIANLALANAATAQAAAEAAQSTADLARQEAATAEGKAVAAQTTADSAITIANAADAKAGEAKTDAVVAKGIAEASYTNATNAQVAATAAQTAAGEAKTAAATAQTTADTAITNAATADTKAVAAQQTADTALANAATADGKATAAQGTADTALANAATADSKAVAAQTTANTAVSNAAAADSKAGDAQDTADANTTALATLTATVEGIQEDIKNRDHFRGYYATTAEIEAITPVFSGDYAYNAATGTKWTYNGTVWADTGVAVPDQSTPLSDTTPLGDGVATPGTANAAARGDHVHPRIPIATTIIDGTVTLASDSDFTSSNRAATPTNVAAQVLPAKTAADNAQATADTAVTNAATADGKAVAAQTTADQALANAATADGKAVAAQGTADTALSNAATVDGKATAAQTAADNAQTTADTALANAATADGKAVTAQNTADAAVTNAATADGKAVIAQQAAATADGKAVAAQTTANTAITSIEEQRQNSLLRDWFFNPSVSFIEGDISWGGMDGWDRSVAGGNFTADAMYRLSWSNRIMAIPVIKRISTSQILASSGYVNVTLPAVGTHIPALGEEDDTQPTQLVNAYGIYIPLGGALCATIDKPQGAAILASQLFTIRYGTASGTVMPDNTVVIATNFYGGTYGGGNDAQLILAGHPIASVRQIYNYANRVTGKPYFGDANFLPFGAPYGNVCGYVFDKAAREVRLFGLASNKVLRTAVAAIIVGMPQFTRPTCRKVIELMVSGNAANLQYYKSLRMDVIDRLTAGGGISVPGNLIVTMNATTGMLANEYIPLDFIRWSIE